MKFARFFVVLLCCLLLLRPAAAAQAFYFADNRKQDMLTFDMVRNLVIIPVYINYKGPFNFVLDTGAGPMLITNPKLKDSLQLGNLRPVQIAGLGAGEAVDAYRGTAIHAQVGQSSASQLSVVILKEDILSLSGYLGKDIAGLIGYDFFNSFMVRINYAARTLTFSQYGKKPPRVRGEKIPLEIIDQKPYINARLQAEAYGQLDVKLIVDCGASHAIALETYANKGFTPPGNSIPGNLGIGLSGEISGKIGRVSELRLGAFIFKEVLANYPAFADVAAKNTYKERNGNLGADILRRFNVVFDYRNNMMYLKKNSLFNRPFEHDMSGMEIYRGNRPYVAYFLGRIEPDSPAEKAGLHPNDELIALNFRKIEDYTFDEINGLLKSGNGRTLIVEIVRDKGILVKLLKLKKRI